MEQEGIRQEEIRPPLERAQESQVNRAHALQDSQIARLEQIDRLEEAEWVLFNERIALTGPNRPDRHPFPGAVHHRVREFAWHIPWYGFKTQTRLALDSGISPSTVSRILRGVEVPSLAVALHLTQALSLRLEVLLDLRQVFSLDGGYVQSVCALCRCRACEPPTAYDPNDNHLSGAAHLSSANLSSGQWVKPLPRKRAR